MTAVSRHCATNNDAVSWRRFNAHMVAFMAFAMAAVPLVNVAADPFGVFGTRLLPDGSQLNERVVKLRHLTTAPRYDTLILGSSVMGVVDPTPFGPGAYNAAVFAATPADLLAIVQVLDAHGRLSPRLIIGLDPFLFAKPKTHVPQMRLPPEASGQSRFQFWNDFLYASSVTAILGKLEEARSGTAAVAFDRRTGRYGLPRLEAERAADPEAYERLMIHGYQMVQTPGWWHMPSEEDLLQLVAFLQSRPGVSVTWVAAPLHPRLRPMLGDGLAQYRQTVERVHPLIDLTDDPVTQRDADWHEIKHVRGAPLTGALTAALRSSTHLARQE